MSIEVLVLLAVIVGVGTLLTWLEAPVRNHGRYSGPVYDPQKPLIRRAGAVGNSGRKCHFCGVTTFGLGDRCGKCGRLAVVLPRMRTEKTKRRSLVESK
jgi:hypothetical protein